MSQTFAELLEQAGFTESQSHAIFKKVAEATRAHMLQECALLMPESERMTQEGEAREEYLTRVLVFMRSRLPKEQVEAIEQTARETVVNQIVNDVVKPRLASQAD